MRPHPLTDEMHLTIDLTLDLGPTKHLSITSGMKLSYSQDIYKDPSR